MRDRGAAEVGVERGELDIEAGQHVVHHLSVSSAGDAATGCAPADRHS